MHSNSMATSRLATSGLSSDSLKAVPWIVPGFTVERYSGELMALQEAFEGGQSLRFVSGHFLVHARKPA